MCTRSKLKLTKTCALYETTYVKNFGKAFVQKKKLLSGLGTNESSFLFETTVWSNKNSCLQLYAFYRTKHTYTIRHQLWKSCRHQQIPPLLPFLLLSYHQTQRVLTVENKIHNIKETTQHRKHNNVGEPPHIMSVFIWCWHQSVVRKRIHRAHSALSCP